MRARNRRKGFMAFAVLSIYDYAFVLPFGALRHFDGRPTLAAGFPDRWLLVVMDVSQMGSRRSSACRRHNRCLAKSL